MPEPSSVGYPVWAGCAGFGALKEFQHGGLFRKFGSLKVHGGNVRLGKLMSFIHVYALGGENLGPAIGESGGGTIRVLGGGPIASDNGQVHSLAVEGGPKLEQPLELGGSASFWGGGALLILVDLSLDLRVGNFRGAFVKQARACHDNDAFGVCLNEFADEGWAFHEGSRQTGIVEGHSSSRLENELELALGRMRVFA